VGVKERQGQAWSAAEQRRLTEAFGSGARIEELAMAHQRSRGAVRKRLERLGLMECANASNRNALLAPGLTLGVKTESDAGSPPTPKSSGSLEPNDGPARGSSTTGLPEETLSRPEVVPDLASVVASIDHLIFSLETLKADAIDGKLQEHKVTAVTSAYERFDAELLSTVHQPKRGEDVCHDDPLPERLRDALRNLVRTCVPKLKDRYVAVRALGLADDGSPATLATIGEELGISRERVRQRRIRTFHRIDAQVTRRVSSASKLRTVLRSASVLTDWSDPKMVAPFVVKYVSDHFEAAKELTVICCKAAGSLDPGLREVAQNAALKACKDPEILGKWRLDRWADAVGAAIGAFAHFDAPPIDLVGRKRMPAVPSGSAAAEFPSEKLGRDVACESGPEYRVLNWLEQSPEVSWYQEQPVGVPYTFGGRNRVYYPDVAVWDRQGRVIVVEIKPLFTMYRQDTIVKATAAWNYFAPRGMGYLLVDASGRTIGDLTFKSYDKIAAEEIELQFARGPVPFRNVRERLSRVSGRFDFPAFVSMVVNRDWAVTAGPAVRVCKLADGVSFRPFLRRAESHPDN
jgi:Sigma-70, region 4